MAATGGSFGLPVLREDCGKLTNQKQEFTVVAMFVSESEQNGQSI
jgi:hypothetical protein